MKVLSCFLVAFLVAHALSQESIPGPPSSSTPTCNNGMVYTTCGTACPLTCDNHKNPPLFCTLQCVAGCFCPSSLLQHNGRCVEASECPAEEVTPSITPAQPTPQCSTGMTHEVRCGRECELITSCENYQEQPHCDFHCEERCFCPRGLVNHNGECMEPSVCAATPLPGTESCSNGTVYNNCGMACRLTCDNYQDAPLPCAEECVAGCYCPWWMVQHEGGCIVHTKCPVIQTTGQPTVSVLTTPQCPNGMTHEVRCGRECELITSCDNYQEQPHCDFHCEERCFCPRGLVTHNGECVKPSVCAVTTAEEVTPSTTPAQPTTECPTGMTHEVHCGRECELITSCDNYQEQPHCDFHCEERCFCPRGLVAHNGECVGPSVCAVTTAEKVTPSTTPAQPTTECPAGMTHEVRCGRECELITSCDNYEEQLHCDFHCEERCFCPHGLVNHNGECVEPSVCAAATTKAAMPSTTPAQPTPECPAGMTHEVRCGRECELITSCENYQEQPHCDFHCEERCFCPRGLVTHNGECVEPSVCTAEEVTPAQPTTECPTGMTHEVRCGRECELITSCENYQEQPHCDFHCEERCFCPRGLVTHNGECVEPSVCTAEEVTPAQPTTECPTGMTHEVRCGRECELITSCENYQEQPHCDFHCEERCFCPHGLVNHNGECMEPSICAVTRADSVALTTPIPQTDEDTPTTHDCTSWLGWCQYNWYCNTEHEKEAYFAGPPPPCPPPPPGYTPPPRPGVCRYDILLDQCQFEPETPDTPPTTSSPPTCTNGREYRECGPICPDTCDTVNGRLPCFSLRCGSPGCYCPSGTVLHEGRCILPSECHKSSQSVDLPTTNENKLLLSMNSRGQEREDFENMQQSFMDAIERLLETNGFPGVTASLHAVYVESHLKIVVELSGSDITDSEAEELAALLNTYADLLPFPVDQVSVVEVPQEQPDDEDTNTLAAISGTLVFIVAMIFIAVVMVVVYCRIKIRKTTSKIPRGEMYRYTALADIHGKVQTKLVKESLT